jgi:pimeloyl-ACP methyl ester carboxylesterase
MTELALAGYRAVAPAMRGYWSAGAAPDGCYQSWATGGDALALIEALGEEAATIIGHDWGASAAYAAAALDPARVERLVTLAVPYGPQVGAAMILDGDQQRRSWYMFFFQTALALPAVAANEYAFIDRLWGEWSPGYRLPDPDRAALKKMFSEPGVLGQTLDYYRQLFGGASVMPEWAEQAARAAGMISAPTLYLHGRNDGCMGVSLMNGMEARFSGGLTQIVVENAGHFLHLERPDVVAAEIVAFLKSSP